MSISICGDNENPKNASNRPIIKQSAAGRHYSEGGHWLIYHREVLCDQPGSSLIYSKCLKHSTECCELHCE